MRISNTHGSIVGGFGGRGVGFEEGRKGGGEGLLVMLTPRMAAAEWSHMTRTNCRGLLVEAESTKAKKGDAEHKTFG